MTTTALPIPATDPRIVERALDDLQPGDRIVRYRSARTGTWQAPRRTLLVTHALAPVHLGGPKGVRLFNSGGIDHVLYPDSIDRVEVVPDRGVSSPNAVAWHAVKTLGWTASGGCYFNADGQFIVRGADQLVRYALAKGLIAHLGTRWYITGQGRAK